MAAPPPTYTREEMDAILKRAIERQQAKADGIGHEELVEAAGEVGIPREEVEAAARELADQKDAQTKRAGAVRDGVDDGGHGRERDLVPPEARRREVRRFFGRAVWFGLITLVLFGLSGMHWNGWWIWAALGFGLSLARSAIRLAFGDGTVDGERNERRLSRRERRAQRRLRREETLEEFERKVAIGADALLRVIDEARRVKVGGADRAPRPPPTGPRVIVTPAPPVRVDSRERDGVEREERDEGAAPAGDRQKRAP